MADTWTQLRPVHSPPARFDHGMAYDITNNLIVVFGGQSAIGLHALNDTWTWDGTDWTQQFPATVPSARTGVGMTSDYANGNVVMFGGFDGSNVVNANQETWIWDGTDWTLQAPATLPSRRWIPIIGYDTATSKVVMFGGSNTAGVAFADTWTWDGTDWTNMAPATQPFSSANIVRQHAMNLTLNRLVHLGGGSGATPPRGTWTWNGVTWTELAVVHSPASRFFGAMAQWTAGRTLAFGGRDGATFLNDTWLFNGTDWTQQSPATSPAGREEAGIAFQLDADYILLFGGRTLGDVASAETWMYGAGATSLAVALGYGGVVPQGGYDRTNPTLLQSALPPLYLTPGCTVSLRSETADGTLRSADVWTDVRLWVDDGS